MENFPKRLKLAMQIRGFRQIDLANETGIDRGTISRYLNGEFKPKAKNVILIADALKVNELWLLGNGEVPMDIDPSIEYVVDPDDVNRRAYMKLEYSNLVEMNISQEEWCALYKQFDTLSEKSKIDIMKYIYLIFTMEEIMGKKE